MKGRCLSRGRVGVVVALTVLLMAGHGIILYYASSHFGLSARLVAGVILLIVIKHLGLLSPAYRLVKIFMRRDCNTEVSRRGALDSGCQVADWAQAEQGH
jgi:hypothetical protein